MKLIVSDADVDQVKSAFNRAGMSGFSVALNPIYLPPDDERLYVACGKPAVQMLQSMGWLPNKGGVEANRGKLFTANPTDWPHPVSVGVSYAPQVYHIDYSNFVAFEADIAIYRRFEATGSMDATLGKYGYADDLSGVIDYVKKKHAITGLPVEVALDLETEGLHPWYPNKNIVTIQATAHVGCTDVIYCLDYKGKQLQNLIDQVHWLATCPYVKTIGANFKFDILWMRVKWGIKFKNFAFDTCNVGSLIEENRSNTLNLHTKIYAPDLGGYDDEFGRKYNKGKMELVPKEALLPYAGGDTDACLQVYHAVRGRLLDDNVNLSGNPAKRSLTSLYVNIVHPTLKAVHKMEYNGACVDAEKFHLFGAELNDRMKETMVKAADYIPGPILDKHGGIDKETGQSPLSKPNMIADFLFSPMGLNLEPLTVTEKTGKPSTAEHHLSQFADHPDAKELLTLYLDYKRVSKMHGTYYKGFLNHLRPDDRWHSSYIIHKAGFDRDDKGGAAGTVCVTADTLFTTTKGVIPYTALKKGDEVLTHLGKTKPITDLIDNGTRPVVRVTTADGNSLTCTENHPFLTQSGWVNASDLVLAQVVFSLSGAEEWRKVPDWPLQVSSWGRVTSHTGTILAQTPKGRWGHLKVSCCRDKKWVRGEHYKDFPVHRLVASVFVDNPENLPQVRHLNGLVWDNRADNLVWGTDQHNRNDMKNHGTGRGTKSNQKLTEQQIGFITKDPRTHASIAKEYGVSRRLVGMVKAGERRSYPPTTPPKATFAPTKVSAIEVLPPQPTFGVTVKDAHSHVTNGLVTHNTGRGSATAPAFQCVSGDALIRVPEGVRRADALIDPVFVDTTDKIREHELTVWTRKGWRETSHVFRSWRSDLLEIRLKNGNALKCTPEHPLLMSCSKWVEARNITNSMKVANIRDFEQSPAPDWCTPTMAKALGVILADGDRRLLDNGRLCITLSLTGAGVMSSLLGDLPAKLEQHMNGDKVDFILPEPATWTEDFAAWVEQLCHGDHVNGVAIPDLIGTERSLDVYHGMFRVRGQYRTAMQGHAIIPGLKGPAYRFATIDLMTRGWTHGSRSVAGSTGLVIYGHDSYLFAKATKTDDNYPPHLAARYSGPKHFRGDTSGHYVVSVEPAEPGYVYDFTVPEEHEFQANGMTVHNTVPKHSYWGKRLRECIIAPDGKVIVAADYAQGELKVAACWAGETNMITAYKNGIDLHVLTAATVNGMSYEEAMFLKKNNIDAYKDLRQRGKAGNFGLLYGMSAYGFMMYAGQVYGVELTLEEAEEMRDAFFDLYPVLPIWHTRQIAEAATTGQVRSPLGRVRHLPTIHSPIKKIRHSTENQAINSPIQGTLVDMLWWSMGILERDIPDRLTPFAQIHDQGLWYANEDTYEADLKCAVDVMENLPFEQKFGWKPELTFNVDAEWGKNLADLQGIAY